MTVYRVRPARRRAAGPPRHRLTYPDGAHDAETLLVAPADRPAVRGVQVAPSVAPCTPLRAPLFRRRHRTGSRPFARVSGLVTDGTFFAGGRRVLLRTYGTASVYTFPGFALVGTVPLPAQRQGEGVAKVQASLDKTCPK